TGRRDLCPAGAVVRALHPHRQRAGLLCHAHAALLPSIKRNGCEASIAAADAVANPISGRLVPPCITVSALLASPISHGGSERRPRRTFSASAMLVSTGGYSGRSFRMA